MKLMTFFLFVAVMHVAAATYSQTTKLTIVGQNLSIGDVLDRIETQSDFSFFFNADQLELKKRINIDADKQLVSVILDEILNGSGLTYTINNKLIVIHKPSETGNVLTLQQQKSVSGKVTDAKGLSLPGVSVVIIGTNIGTITDGNGDFSLSNIPENQILQFTFIGMKSQQINIGSKNNFNIVMEEETIGVDEVVVTALGIKREKKALGYSVGEVKSDQMVRVPQKDILGALQGKMSGVRITNTSNDVNADTYVNIRGITSLSGNNAPLVVVDGVPVGNDKMMKDLSTDNIESVTVLKGPSAAALYGSRAGTGVILITSKSGKTKKNGIGVEVSVGSTYSVPYKYINLQNRFTTGISGVLNESAYQQWNGPEEGASAVQWNTNGIAKPLKFYNNTLQDFFQTGLETVINASVNGSYDRGSYRLSVSHLGATGVYPGVELDRKGVNMAATYNITQKVKLSTNLDIENPNSDNYPVKNGGDSQYMALYQTPPHVNINDLKDYWKTPNVLQKGVSTNYDNPWFAAYELKDAFNRMRMFGNIKLDYQILPDLKVMGRYAYSYNNNKRKYRQPWSSYGGDGGGQNTAFGLYQEQINDEREMNADALISYTKKIEKFQIDLSGGGNLMKQRSYAMYGGGSKLVLAGLYTLSNVDRGSLGYYDYTYKKNIYSAYGLLNLSYNNWIFLDVTARNDWSSTLPKASRSYFYPSASLSVLVNEMVTLPSWVSLLKLRSGLSQVGKDTSPYSISTVLNQGTWGANTAYSVPGSLPNINLKPEIASSFEIGTDVSFLNNRLGFDFTYYKVQNKNQILNASTSSMSGYNSATINAGNIENTGIEIGLNAVPWKTTDWKWDISANFTKERSQLIELTPGIDQFLFWASREVYAWTKVGGYVGDFYGTDMKRVPDGPYKGWPILDANGRMQNGKAGDDYIGSYMHDFMVGLQTSLSYKSVTLSLSFDWRQGGKYMDETMLRLGRAGKVEYTHPGDPGSSTFSGILNNNSFNGDMNALANEIKSHPEIYQNNVWIGGLTQDLGGFLYSNGIYEGAYFPGVRSDGAGGYIENFGAAGTKIIKAYDTYQPTGGYFYLDQKTEWVYDASFVKLREIALSYTLPKSWAGKVGAQDLVISGFMKNILLYAANKTNQDPESIYNNNPLTGQTMQGFVLWNGSPIVMPAGFKINVTF
ncbi:MAG: SusC/RagA family TonB-linked outer membrane protein [Bacteroidota bacterium]|nr:SusC/RagA family TonB-linked outer membrane protein [Bacteroidota bacterium]